MLGQPALPEKEANQSHELNAIKHLLQRYIILTTIIFTVLAIHPVRKVRGTARIILFPCNLCTILPCSTYLRSQKQFIFHLTSTNSFHNSLSRAVCLISIDKFCNLGSRLLQSSVRIPCSCLQDPDLLRRVNLKKNLTQVSNLPGEGRTYWIQPCIGEFSDA